MRTAAVLPIKTFARAKARLGGAVEAPDRAELAEAMASDVLAALTAVPGLADVVVVTAEPRAASAARAAGAVVVHDPQEAGQSAAAGRGVAAAVARGAGRVLLVPGDCPALAPDEVEALLADARAGVTIVPDRHGTGTNALLLEPPDAIEPAFGPGSFARHMERAGAAARVAEPPSLVLDVDTPADLAALRERGDGAPRTRALLERAAFAACR
jgi:2-phospho-L-lactate guanylyltransferase